MDIHSSTVSRQGHMDRQGYMGMRWWPQIFPACALCLDSIPQVIGTVSPPPLRREPSPSPLSR